MQLSDAPDRVVRHEPSCCSGCSAGLAGASEEGVIRRQVTEVPAARAEVTEHRMIGRRCGCGTVTWAGAPAGVTAPVQYGPRAAAVAAYLWHGQFLSRNRVGQAMADLFGCAPSPGALASMTRKIADAAAPAVEAVRDALAGAGVAHFDETGFRVAGRLAWAHSASSGSSCWSPCTRSGAGTGWTRPGCARVRRDRLPRRMGALRLLRRRGRARPVLRSRAPRAERRHRDRHGR